LAAELVDDTTTLQAEETFSAVAEHVPAMLWRGDVTGKCVYLNKAQREFWGLAEADVAAFTWGTTLLPEDTEKVFDPFSEGMRTQSAFKCEGRYRRADGAIRILETHAEPLFDANGVFMGMAGVNHDRTDERLAQAGFSESEARLKRLADNLPSGMIFQIVTSADGSSHRFSFVSSRCEQLNGVTAEQAVADPHMLYNLIAPDHREAFRAAEAEARRAFASFEYDTPMRPRGGPVRWFRIASTPRKLANGDTVWDGVQVDIHDLKMADERQRLLMSEMSHRMKNILSTVISIASQTGRSAPSVAQFNASFQARLQALSKSHDLLWRDASDSADLRDILESELDPYKGEARGLMLRGEPVRLSGRAAVGMALVVHELATNAAKYGAYAGRGSLDVSWVVDRSTPGVQVVMSWQERVTGQHAPVAANPSGFGTKLIDAILRGDLGGSISSDFTNEGLHAELRFLAQGADRLRRG
jgi:PAS domain S-box-containing protein